METLHDAWKIARFDLGTAIRTKRALVALLIYIGGALLTGAILVGLEDQFGDKLVLARSSLDAAAAMATVQTTATAQTAAPARGSALRCVVVTATPLADASWPSAQAAYP